jgi:hypothetical protein
LRELWLSTGLPCGIDEPFYLSSQGSGRVLEEKDQEAEEIVEAEQLSGADQDSEQAIHMKDTRIDGMPLM